MRGPVRMKDRVSPPRAVPIIPVDNRVMVVMWLIYVDPIVRLSRRNESQRRQKTQRANATEKQFAKNRFAPLSCTIAPSYA